VRYLSELSTLVTSKTRFFVEDSISSGTHTVRVRVSGGTDSELFYVNLETCPDGPLFGLDVCSLLLVSCSWS
jgi:hypothetical protein